MLVMSQPPLIALSSIDSYAYPDEDPGSVRIYVVDTGANASVPVSFIDAIEAQS